MSKHAVYEYEQTINSHIFIVAQGYEISTVNNYTNEIFLVQNFVIGRSVMSVVSPLVSAMSRSICDYFHLIDGLFDPLGSLSSQLSSQSCQQGGREGAKKERQQHKTCGTLEYNSAFRVAPPYFVVGIRAKLRI